MPLLLSRNCVPDWVPGGMVKRARLPATVGTSTTPPKEAVSIEIGTLQKMLAPSRWKTLCGAIERKIDRKSTRLNSSHVEISYAVFCLKKKKKQKNNERM